MQRMVPEWLRSPWAHFERSHCAEETWFKAHPKNLALAIVGTALISWGIHFLAPAPVSLRFGSPWVPVLWTFAGTLFSGVFWWRRGEGDLARACVLLDGACYGLALIVVGIRVGPPLSHAFSMAWGLFVTNTQAREVGLSPLPLAFLCGPPLALLLWSHADFGDVVIASLSILLFAYISATTAQQRAMRRQNETLRSALGAVDRIANESMDMAFASILLSLGNMLHELRNTQTATLVNLKHLRALPLIQGDDRQALQEAIDAEERSAAIVGKTLETLRRQSRPTQEQILLAPLAREVAQTVRGLRVLVEEATANLHLVGDPEHSRLVFQNLLRNARQAGATTVRLRASLEGSGTAVRIEVIDDGPGMPPEARAALFRPFATFGKKDGTGLGLFLVKRCIDSMGGSIEVADGGAQRGTTFRILLPGGIAKAVPSGGVS